MITIQFVVSKFVIFIKLSNILIDNDRYPVCSVKICDLGSSKKLISDPNDEST